MYKIGDFSKIVDIPVRTLRYYAEYGVLVPSEIDVWTGYKYYSEDNIRECKVIKLLKTLDFTLDEIIEYKDNLDEEILEKKKAEFKGKIYLLNLKIAKVNQMQKNMQNNQSHIKRKERKKERVLRRNYEKGNIRKII